MAALDRNTAERQPHIQCPPGESELAVRLFPPCSLCRHRIPAFKYNIKVRPGLASVCINRTVSDASVEVDCRNSSNASKLRSNLSPGDGVKMMRVVFERLGQISRSLFAADLCAKRPMTLD